VSRLGLPLKGSPAMSRLGLPLKGSPASGSANPASSRGLWKRSIRSSVLASSVRAATARPGSAVARLMPLGTAAKRRVPPVVQVRQVPSRTGLALRGNVRANTGGSLVTRVLAAASANAGGARSRMQAGVRVRPGVKLGGIAGALLSVKKQEDSDNEGERPHRQRGMVAKVTSITTRPLLRTAASVGARAKAHLRQSAPARTFGYGEGTDNSEDAARDATQKNGRPQKKRPPPQAVKPRQDVRNATGAIMGLMKRHLVSAKRQLSTEKTGVVKVKEEDRWEPDTSPPPAAEIASGSASEDEDVQPHKRARRDEPTKDRKRQHGEKEAEADAKAEAKEMQALQRRLELHYSSMKNFIRTRAEPTIFYLPAKHNDMSQTQLEETRAAISQKIASLKVHLQAAPASVDEEEDEDGEDGDE